jgi:ABC-type transport system involved in cytochrome bd biosynthesis fused ATPase/permease subunit
VVLRGPSGAGKTTLAQLMVRFRDPDGGRVSLGGAHLDAATVRVVMRDLVAGAGGRGVLAITHSDGGAELFEEVWELRGGILHKVK